MFIFVFGFGSDVIDCLIFCLRGGLGGDDTGVNLKHALSHPLRNGVDKGER